MTRVPAASASMFKHFEWPAAESVEAYPDLTQTDLDNAWFYGETFPTEIEQAISANEEE